MDIIDHLSEEHECTLRNGWEYVYLRDYPGQAPSSILGVYRKPNEEWRVISHDYKGRVIDADGIPVTNSRDLELVPAMRKFRIQVERTVIERAYVEVEAVDADEATQQACEVAEENRYDLDWEEYNSTYETTAYCKDITE